MMSFIKLNKFQLFTAGGFLLTIVLAACAPEEPQELIVENTPTATNTPSQTPTVDWFPATSTPTRIPTLAITPTPKLSTNLGEIIFEDDFSEPSLWDLGHTASGNISLGLNELTIAIATAGAYEYSLRSEPILSDYYVEVTTSPTLCQGEDQYGLLLRVSSPGDFYRYALSCDGRIRLDRVLNGAASSPQPWIANTVLPPGAPFPSRLGAWLSGDEMRFFINDQVQFTVKDPSLVNGNIGVFARSQGETAVTVNFSDLIVRQISQ